MNWQESVPDKILKQMIHGKIQPDYKRLSFMDLFAQMLLITPKRSSCLFVEAGALIIDQEENRILASGYNGPPSGGDNCFEVGCSRVVDGEIRKGEGRCRGLHGEVNAILHTVKYGIITKGMSMMSSRKPCYDCAKIIANSGLNKVYYLFDYNRKGEDERPEETLKKANIELIKYESTYLKSLPDYKNNSRVFENY